MSSDNQPKNVYMHHLPPILAAADWFRLLLFVLFFVAPLIFKMIGGKEQVPPHRRGVEPRPAPPQRPKPNPLQPNQGMPNPLGGRQAAAGGGQNAVEDEIEAFLRRARGDMPAAPQPRREIVVEPPDDVRRLVQKTQSIKEQMADGQTSTESVAEHVKQHIESRPVSDHARELGSTIRQSDEVLEGHLHQVFDHDIGLLKHDQMQQQTIREGTDDAVWETAESKRQKRSDASEGRLVSIVAMLRNPESIKQAIILSEVLKRPDFD